MGHLKRLWKLYYQDCFPFLWSLVIVSTLVGIILFPIMIVSLALICLAFQTFRFKKGFIPNFLVIAWTFYILAAQIVQSNGASMYNKYLIIAMPIMMAATLFLALVQSNRGTKGWSK